MRHAFNNLVLSSWLLVSSSALAGDFPALIEAMRDNNLEKVTKLLDQGADVNTVDSRGMSALVHAVSRGDLSMVDTLLSKGADPNPPKHSPLREAARLGHAEVVELLLANDAANGG